MFDPTSHAIRWTESADGTRADFVQSSLIAGRPGGRNWIWSIAAPHATSVTLPTLPSNGFDYNIAATDTFSVQTLTIGRVPGGYDAVRPILLTTSLDNLTAGPTGSAIYETLPPKIWGD